MLKIEKYPSLAVQALVVLAVGLGSIFLFRPAATWLGNFVITPFPWPGWIGGAIWLIVVIYAWIAFLFCWFAQYLMWGTPMVVFFMVVDTLRRRRKQKFKRFQKNFIFQTRILAKSWRNGEFGKNQLEAFLNSAFLAITSGVPYKDLQMWFLMGFRQWQPDADKVIHVLDLELKLVGDPYAPLPELWTNGKPVLVR